MNSNSLNYLDCSNCDFSGKNCPQFFEALEKTHINTLIFDESYIGENLYEELSESFIKINVITKLSLNSCQLYCAGVCTISNALVDNSVNISSLSLQNNMIKVCDCYQLG